MFLTYKLSTNIHLRSKNTILIRENVFRHFPLKCAQIRMRWESQFPALTTVSRAGSLKIKQNSKIYF